MFSGFNLEKTYQFLLITLAFLMPLTVFGGNVIIVLIVILIIFFLVDRYREKKRQNMISRLTGRNSSTDRNPAIAYSNSSYETPGFNNEQLYRDVIVSEASDVGRPSIKNESYYDC